MYDWLNIGQRKFAIINVCVLPVAECEAKGEKYTPLTSLYGSKRVKEFEESEGHTDGSGQEQSEDDMQDLYPGI